MPPEARLLPDGALLYGYRPEGHYVLTVRREPRRPGAPDRVWYELDGIPFRSASAAARFVCGPARRNGWRFWRTYPRRWPVRALAPPALTRVRVVVRRTTAQPRDCQYWYCTLCSRGWRIPLGDPEPMTCPAGHPARQVVVLPPLVARETAGASPRAQPRPQPPLPLDGSSNHPAYRRVPSPAHLAAYLPRPTYGGPWAAAQRANVTAEPRL